MKSFLLMAKNVKNKESRIKIIEKTVYESINNRHSIPNRINNLSVPLYLPEDYTDHCMKCDNKLGAVRRKKHCHYWFVFLFLFLFCVCINIYVCFNIF